MSKAMEHRDSNKEIDVFKQFAKTLNQHEQRLTAIEEWMTTKRTKRIEQINRDMEEFLKMFSIRVMFSDPHDFSRPHVRIDGLKGVDGFYEKRHAIAELQLSPPPSPLMPDPGSALVYIEPESIYGWRIMKSNYKPYSDPLYYN